jgi:hypothetical protein
MIVKPRGKVTMPRAARPGLQVLPWAREVNRALQELRDRVFVATGGKRGGGGAASGECFFGEILSVVDGETTTYYIRGGIIYCGDKNFNAANKELTIGADAVTMIYLEIDCEANRDDDGEIILPGILTSAETDPATFWQSAAYTLGDQYPDNTNPPASTGLGTIIIPIGILAVASGVPTLAPVGCGNVRVDQCAGTLSHTRL